MNPVSPLAEAQPRFKRIQYDLAAHLRDPAHQPAPDDVEDRRVAIYRELLYNNIEGFIRQGFPVLRAITKDEPWHAMVRDFYARHSARSPYFKDVPKEFLSYLEDGRDNPSDPPFLLELAHYEWVELDLDVRDQDPDWDTIDRDGDRMAGTPALSPLVWMLSYDYPVHKIGPDYIPPGPEAASLVVYRNRNDEVGFLEVNPVTLRLLNLLQEGWRSSGRELMLQLADEMQHPNPEVVVAGGAQILQDLFERDIILGTQV